MMLNNVVFIFYFLEQVKVKTDDFSLNLCVQTSIHENIEEEIDDSESLNIQYVKKYF